MYDSTDRQATIREIQRFLLEISFEESYLPHVWVDGVYGERTRDAVRQFQRRYQLPATGTVNAATWALLYRKFSDVRNRRFGREQK